VVLAEPLFALVEIITTGGPLAVFGRQAAFAAVHDLEWVRDDGFLFRFLLLFLFFILFLSAIIHSFFLFFLFLICGSLIVLPFTTSFAPSTLIIPSIVFVLGSSGLRTLLVLSLLLFAEDWVVVGVIRATTASSKHGSLLLTALSSLSLHLGVVWLLLIVVLIVLTALILTVVSLAAFWRVLEASLVTTLLI